MTLLQIRGGSVNADAVVRIQRDSKDGDKAVLNDGAIAEIGDNFFHVPISFVATQGDWECVIADGWDDGKLSKVVEPVLAWGFTVEGMLTPITPLYPMGVTDPHYALRRAGSDIVYSAIAEMQFTVAVWLDMETKRAIRLGDGPVKSGRADG